MLELQIRERFVDEHRTLPAIAQDFEVPLSELVARLNLADMPQEELDRLSLADIARQRHQSLRAFKGDLVRAALSWQLRGTPHWMAPKPRNDPVHGEAGTP